MRLLFHFWSVMNLNSRGRSRRNGLAQTQKTEVRDTRQETQAVHGRVLDWVVCFLVSCRGI
jgi:hypothetical protein